MRRNEKTRDPPNECVVTPNAFKITTERRNLI